MRIGTNLGYRFYARIICRSSTTATGSSARIGQTVAPRRRAGRHGRGGFVKPYRVTLIHPCVGRQPGQSYIRTWQMEPLPAASIAGLTPRDVEVRFYDDRMEAIPFDEPTDLVAISVETYTAKRAYQIASEYRRRRVPVVMGGFHATLCPDEVARYAEAVVIGEAEALWPRVIDDARHGRTREILPCRRTGPRSRSSAPTAPIFRGKRYLPIGLVEAGRGCHFKCEFCAVQSDVRRTPRPGGRSTEILAELRAAQGPEAYLLLR